MDKKVGTCARRLKMQKRRGFTLIELLVVISIIALLLAILMPALSAVKARAQQVVCASSLKGIGLAVSAYLTSNDDAFHAGNNNGLWRDWLQNPTSPPDLEYDHGYAYWGIAYADYSGGKDIFYCPSAKPGYVDSWLLSWEIFGGRALQEVKDYFKYCAFGLNGYTNSWGSSIVKATHFKRPSEVIFAQDHIEQKMDSTNSDMFCIGPSVSINLTQWRGFESQARSGSLSTNDRGAYFDVVQKCFRHSRRSISSGSGNSNTLWLDGHVTTIVQTDGEDVPVKWYTGI